MMRLLILAVILAALPGCALLPSQDAGTRAPSAQQLADWNARRVALAPVAQFVLRGRVASGALGFKADLRWKQLADGRFEMRLAGPFGAGAAVLEGDAREVRVRTGDAATSTTTTDPEAWLEQTLGLRLPVSGLRWWALGLPAPETDNQVLLDPAGRALRIVQNGWELNYLEYRRAEALDLPRRIEARNGDTRVLVLADAWSGLAPARASLP